MPALVAGIHVVERQNALQDCNEFLHKRRGYNDKNVCLRDGVDARDKRGHDEPRLQPLCRPATFQSLIPLFRGDALSPRDGFAARSMTASETFSRKPFHTLSGIST
jgi:hypothetical protein